MSYKDYQQVLNLSSPIPAKTAVSKKCTPKKDSSANINHTPVKRRTKTGCFTCRRRKKKCDMDKVDGKCQGCIRNFLDCCWPEVKGNDAKRHSHEATVTIPSSIESSPELVKPEIIKVEQENIIKGANAYPSPISSPQLGYKSDNEDIKTLVLPAASTKNYKIYKPTSKIQSIATSPKTKVTKFIITTFNSENELCQVKN